ncbi:MAG: hypothetical protein A2Y07_02855 [Planctomycetes bacterium GWF2_50_10]|nr:MAG: hypothetical protein A2Y07_02855 [Planctomycetes bacterium GWF2_50_10]
MTTLTERRTEKRLRYSWPVWFAENFDGVLNQGQMVDVASGGAAFTCYADASPYPGQPITARFSVPQYGNDDSFDMQNFIRSGKVCRVEDISPYVRRVAVQFATPLSFKPAQAEEPEQVFSDFATVGTF